MQTPTARPQQLPTAHLPGSIFDGAPIISTYTRRQALADGVLVDVTQAAKEKGFRCPVAVTAAVRSLIEDIPANRRAYESTAGRLADVCWMAYVAARMNPQQSQLLYRLTLTRLEPRMTRQGRRNMLIRDLTLKLHAGPGDDGELVITILLPNED